MKGSTSFKDSISSHLELVAIQDSLFAETLKKPNKSIDECVNYILETVQKSGINGFEDNEIYQMAIHYYDEDDLKASSSKSNVRVAVNHIVTLSEQDKADAKKKAMDQLVEEERKRMSAKHKIATPSVSKVANPLQATTLKVIKKVIQLEPAQGSLF
jgi:hypothetical protein